jgi:hypothetical protein
MGRRKCQAKYYKDPYDDKITYCTDKGTKKIHVDELTPQSTENSIFNIEKFMEENRDFVEAHSLVKDELEVQLERKRLAREYKRSENDYADQYIYVL